MFEILPGQLFLARQISGKISLKVKGAAAQRHFQINPVLTAKDFNPC
jgi:hypothetical protein